jgi:acetyl esterase/lipase
MKGRPSIRGTRRGGCARLQAFGALLLLPLLAAAQAPVPPYPPVPEKMPGAQTFIYKQHGTVKLPLFVFSPEAAKADDARAAIVFFHGSGWLAGSVYQFAGYARELARHGIVAAVAEYRIKEGYGATPFDGVADAKSAVRWLRQNASRLGIRSDRIVAAGGSAGAHIALAAAVFESRFDDPGDEAAVPARPDALVLFVPIVDTTETGYRETVPLFGGRERELSPIHHLHAGLPPTLIFYGTADAGIPPELIERFCGLMRNLNNRCELAPFVGRNHFFYNHPSYFKLRPHMKDLYPGHDFVTALFVLEQFLHEQGFMSGLPRVDVVPDP